MDIVTVEGKNIWRTPKAGFGITGMKIQWAMAIVYSVFVHPSIELVKQLTLQWLPNDQVI